MDPDMITVPELAHDGIRKGLICFSIGVHGVVIEASFVELVMEKRPERGIFEESVSMTLSNKRGGMLTREAVIVEV